ncbi:MAG: ABC transporter substrate-binding protein [Chloroflexota bacterium]
MATRRRLSARALAALLALIIPLLAACGGQQPTGGTSPTTAPAEEPAATTAPADEPAGGSTGGAQPPFTIGVSNGFVGSEWRTQMIQDLQDVNAELMAAGLTNELVIESADTDVPGQIQQIRNLINRGVDAIIINPNDVQALNPVIKEAADAGIIVIAVDQEISAPEVINVVIDQTEWARISARWLVEKLGGEGDVVVINGIAGHPANEARYAGVQEVFAEHPGINVLNVVNANWDQATGQQRMADLLASQPNIDGVWTQDGMASGALRAVMAANPAEWPVMVGEARIEYLRLWDEVRQTKPDFESFGVVNPPGIGASGLRIAVELLQGRQFKEGALGGPYNNSLYVPIPGTVSAENFEEELAKYQDAPQSYTLDGILTDEEAKAFFQ